MTEYFFFFLFPWVMILNKYFVFLSIEDDDSGDEDDYLSRNAIKRTSQQIVDAKNKKNKPRQKKNKKK